MKTSGEFPGIATVDFMLGMVVLLMVFLRISLAAMTIQQTKQEQIKTGALYLIVVTWPGDSPDDVDTYVEDPVKHLVYWRRLQDGLMCLDRDDTGCKSNSAHLPNGQIVQSPINEERVEIRGVIPGEYVVNLHMFSKHGEYPNPDSVDVSLYKMAFGEAQKVHSETVVLSKNGDERTAFRFTLDTSGNVSGFNTLQKHFTDMPPQ